MKTLLVGIDISKDWLDYSTCCKEELTPSKSKRVDNNANGILKMLSSLRKRQDTELWICFEHTGNYGLLLSSILQINSVKYSAVPAMEIKRSQGITRGKSDEVDAQRIAEYAAVHAHKIRPSELPSENLLKVKQLLTYRDQLVKIKTQLMNSKKSFQLVEQVVELEYISNNIQEKIHGLEADIKHIEKQIEGHIKSNKTLKNNYDLITSVKGIGLVVAAFMLVYTQNFEAFDDPRKFNCYTGIAPFENSSGLTKGRSSTSNFGHKRIKTLIYNGANSATTHDPQLKAYYNRKKNEGKKHNCIMNAVACKLVARAFATVKRQTPYVTLLN